MSVFLCFVLESTLKWIILKDTLLDWSPTEVLFNLNKLSMTIQSLHFVSVLIKTFFFFYEMDTFVSIRGYQNQNQNDCWLGFGKTIEPKLNSKIWSLSMTPTHSRVQGTFTGYLVSKPSQTSALILPHSKPEHAIAWLKLKLTKGSFQYHL